MTDSEELDMILLEQLVSLRRRMKNIKVLRKLTNFNEDLDMVEQQMLRNMTYFEYMIVDKTLLTKRIKIKKPRVDDVLERNMYRQMMKSFFTYTNMTYKVIAVYWDIARTTWWGTRE